MRLKQISNEEFNSYSQVEPTSSIFQTTMYGEKMADKNKRILCLAAFDDHNIVVGLAMFLIRKEGFLSLKQSAYCPCGYLVNYYDFDTLSEFDRLVKEFLKNEKVSTIIIDPQIRDSFMIEDNLNRLSYSKKAVSNRYEISLKNFKFPENYPLIYKCKEISFNEVDDSKEAHPYLEICRSFPSYSHLYTVYIDVNATLVQIRDSEYDKTDLFNYISSFEKQGNITVGTAGIIEYARRCDLLFADVATDNQHIDGRKAIFCSVGKVLIEKKYKKFYSLQCSGCLDEKPLIGEFSSEL